MKKNPILTIILCALALVFVVSCASTKDASSAMKANNVVERIDETYVVDWRGKTLGTSMNPKYLYDIMEYGNEETLRTNFGINKSYVIKVDEGTGITEADAKLNAKILYNSNRAEEVRTSVLVEAGNELGTDTKEYENFQTAAMVAQAQLSGQEIVTDFWQKTVTVNKDTGLDEVKYRCWVIYKIPNEAWLNTIKAFMKSTIPSLSEPESKKSVAGLVDKIYESTSSNSPKLEAEINTRQESIPNSQPVSNPEDIEWLKLLDTAADIIF